MNIQNIPATNKNAFIAFRGKKQQNWYLFRFFNNRVAQIGGFGVKIKIFQKFSIQPCGLIKKFQITENSLRIFALFTPQHHRKNLYNTPKNIIFAKI